MDVPAPLPLRTIEVPREVSAVEGCDCGGLDWHRGAASWSPLAPCSIWQLPPDQAQAAIDAAHERMAAFTAELNRRLRQELVLPVIADPGLPPGVAVVRSGDDQRAVITTPAALRDWADRIERMAPVWAGRLRREADRMDADAGG
jgi:hypothetical protein